MTEVELASLWVGGAVAVTALASTALFVGRWRVRWTLLEPAVAVIVGIALWRHVGAWTLPPPPRAILLGLVAALHLSPRLPRGRYALLSAALLGPLSATALLAPRARDAREGARIALAATALAPLSPLGGPLMALVWTPSWALWVLPWSTAVLLFTGLPAIDEPRRAAPLRPLRHAAATGVASLAAAHAGVALFLAAGLRLLPTVAPRELSPPIAHAAVGAVWGLLDPWWTAPLLAHAAALSAEAPWTPVFFGAVANPLLALLIAARVTSWRALLYGAPGVVLLGTLGAARLWM